MGAGRPDRSFPRACRLASSHDYRRVYRSRWRGRCGPLTWHARANRLPYPRLGMAVPKRAVKRATDRSRIKRLIRESFRNNRDRLPSVDVVISVRALPRGIHDTALRQRIDKIWDEMLLSGNQAP